MSDTSAATQTPQRDDSAEVTPYDLIGGEAAVRALTDRFYDLMDLEPRFAELRAMHPEDMAGARDNLFWFLSGWLGGPQLFVERKGHPMLRRRHMPFSIGEKERDQWVQCMVQAMEEESVDDALRTRLAVSFFQTADFMRNREG